MSPEKAMKTAATAFLQIKHPSMRPTPQEALRIWNYQNDDKSE